MGVPLLKRTRRLLLSASIALLVCGLATPAAATSATAEERDVTLVYVLRGPNLVDGNGNLKLDPRQEGAIERAGLQPAVDTDVRPMTDAEARKRAIAEGAEYGTPSEEFADPAVEPQQDDITVEECRDNAELSSRPQGWIKNHFSYCQLDFVVAVHIRCRLICWTAGYFQARITLLAVAYNGLRNVEYTPHLDQIIFYGTATPGVFSYEVECAGSPNSDSCLPAESEVARSPAQWEADSEATLFFNSPAEPPSPSLGEQVDTGVFQVDYEFRFPARTVGGDGPETSAPG
jgi:hypothetical protein